jgi:hypothetical protein
VGVNSSVWIWNGSTYVQQSSSLPNAGSWISETTTITGSITNPVKGTTNGDYIRYRQLNSKEYIVDLYYNQITAGAAGGGNYLYKLPTGLTFDSSIYTFYTGGTYFYRDAVRAQKGLKSFSCTISSTSLGTFCSVLPYDSTRFRISTFSDINFQGLGSFNLGDANLIVSVSFILQVP